MSTVIGKTEKEELHCSPDVLMGTKQRVEGIVYRADQGPAAIVDKDERQIRVSFSSDTPYLRTSWWEDPWIEVLGHAEDEVDLSRMNNGASVHYNHSRMREDRLGAVLEASTDGKKTSAMIQLSQRESIDDIWNDLLKGLIKNVSVGYKIHERILMKHNEDGPDEYRVTKWEPVEISIVDIPADPTVGVGRGDGVEHCYRVLDLDTAPAASGETNEDDTVTKGKENDRSTPTDDTVTKTVADELAKKAADEASKKATEQALASEADRQQQIRAVFDGHEATKESEEILKKCLTDQDCAVDQARELLLDEIGKRKTPTGVGHFQPGEDAADKFRDAVINSIQVRAAVKDVKAEDNNPYRGLPMFDIARACLEMNNMSTLGSPTDVFKRAFMMRAGAAIGLTPSDFPQILADVANKSVLLGFGEAAETWQVWCRVGNLSDFKVAHRVGLSSFEDLEMIGAGGEYPYGKFTDTGETIQLAGYGKIFPITRQAMINDDLQVLTAIPEKMGRAAARIPGDLAYIALTSNPLMSDGVALFDAAHNNIGTGGAIAINTVEEAGTLMALQTDVSGSATGLNTEIGFLLVPRQLKGTAETLRRSEYDPADTSNSRAPNSVQNTFEVVSEARLSADSAAQWYAVAQTRFDTIEVAFLDGVQEPRVEEKAGWTVDGVEFKIALDVAASPMEFRSFVRNAGA